MAEPSLDAYLGDLDADRAGPTLALLDAILWPVVAGSGQPGPPGKWELSVR